MKIIYVLVVLVITLWVSRGSPRSQLFICCTELMFIYIQCCDRNKVLFDSMSSTRPVYRDAVRFVRIVNVCRQLVQSTVMLYVSFALSTYVVNSCCQPGCYTFRSHCQRMSSTRAVYRDAKRFIRIDNVCRQLVQSTAMLYVSSALSTYVVNSCCQPGCYTFRSHCQRMSSTRAVYRDAKRFIRIDNVCRQLVQSTVMLYVFVRIVNVCRLICSMVYSIQFNFFIPDSTVSYAYMSYITI